jgi:hypothetical protein
MSISNQGPIQGANQGANQVTTIQTSGASRPNVLNADNGVKKVITAGDKGFPKTTSYNLLYAANKFLVA